MNRHFATVGLVAVLLVFGSVAAGVFGLMMPGKPKVGDKFYQELAPKVAMDRCEVVGLSTTIKTPAGEFTDCLRTKETSPLESGASVKSYAPGVGMVRDDEFLLVKVERPTQGKDGTGWTSLFNGKNLDGGSTTKPTGHTTSE